MGVIDHPIRNRRAKPPSGMYILDPNGGHSDEEDIVAHAAAAAAAVAATPASAQHESHRRRNVKKLKCNAPQPADHPKCSGRKAQGSKVSRRMENLTFLYELFGHELQLDGVTEPVYEQKFSAFAQLLCEKEKMKVWNKFISLGEEEQEAVLNKVPASSVEDADADAVVNSDAVEDKRSGHPSYSGPECFARIEHRLQQMLRRRHVPAGIVTTLETDIRTFFEQQPTSNYVTSIESCYERLVVHAVCQYLDLLSQSFDSDGHRKTLIQNKHASFCPPHVTLISFIESSCNYWQP